MHVELRKITSSFVYILLCINSESYCALTPYNLNAFDSAITICRLAPFASQFTFLLLHQ